MDSLIRSLQAEGRFDSSGSFTVDHFRQRAKLSRFQLPHRGFWLLKLVQGALACEAREIDIRLGSNVRVSFVPSGPGCLEDLIPSLLEGRTGRGPSFDLTAGLLAVAERAESIQVEDPVRGCCLELTAAGHRLLPLRGSSSCSLFVALKGTWKGLLGSWLDSIGGCGDERAALHWRLAFAPAKIRVNGGVLPVPYEIRSPELNPWPDLQEAGQIVPLRRLLAEHRQSQPTFEDPPWLAVRRYLDNGPGTFASPLGPPPVGVRGGVGVTHQGISMATSSLDEWLPFPGATGPLEGCRRALLFWRHPEGGGQLLPVRHGVLLEPQAVELGAPGALAIADVSHLDLDLSHFRLVENQAYQQLLESLRQQVADFCRTLWERLGDDPYLRKHVLPRYPR